MRTLKISLVLCGVLLSALLSAQYNLALADDADDEICYDLNNNGQCDPGEGSQMTLGE